jgi:RNA polymerase sigma factor (TIGR02999 family)
MPILRVILDQNQSAQDHARTGLQMAAYEQAADRNPQSITDLLLQIRDGSPQAMDRLFPLVYEALRRIARRQLRAERPGHTLDTSGLVHETYLKLVDHDRLQWQDRGHFFAIASRAMRQILIDYARRYRSLRRGRGAPLEELHEEDAIMDQRGDTLLALDEALERLAAINPRLNQVVECRYFGGLTEEETAEALGVTTRTVQRDWAKARGWLYLELRSSHAELPP